MVADFGDLPPDARGRASRGPDRAVRPGEPSARASRGPDRAVRPTEACGRARRVAERLFGRGPFHDPIDDRIGVLVQAPNEVQEFTGLDVVLFEEASIAAATIHQ